MGDLGRLKEITYLENILFTLIGKHSLQQLQPKVANIIELGKANYKAANIGRSKSGILSLSSL